MARNWEPDYSRWARPPNETEDRRCENAIKAIRKAIKQSDKLKNRSLTVFVQGSYRNRVNVRQDSDIDVGVLCNDSFFYELPEGTTEEALGISVPADYQYAQFKNELVEAMVAYFGHESVRRGNKAIDVRENAHDVDADVAPFFEHRHHLIDGKCRFGAALSPDNGPLILNYPERLLDSWPQTPLHYENGVWKNKKSHRSYKGVVRILKTIRSKMDEASIPAANPIPGFLIECMVWNAPIECFRGKSWTARVDSVILYLRLCTKDEEQCMFWTEVNAIKRLFESTQPWTRSQAHAFINAVQDYITAG